MARMDVEHDQVARRGPAGIHHRSVGCRRRPLQAALVAVRSLSFWLTLFVGTIVATLFTGALMAWMPLHGLWAEMFSLGLRLIVAALFDGIIACWLLATLAVCVRRVDAAYATPAGGPDDSQPRTAETP